METLTHGVLSDYFLELRNETLSLFIPYIKLHVKVHLKNKLIKMQENVKYFL